KRRRRGHDGGFAPGGLCGGRAAIIATTRAPGGGRPRDGSPRTGRRSAWSSRPQRAGFLTPGTLLFDGGATAILLTILHLQSGGTGPASWSTVLMRAVAPRAGVLGRRAVRGSGRPPPC